MTDAHRPNLRLSPDLLKRVDRYWHRRELPSRHAALIELIEAHLAVVEAFWAGKDGLLHDPASASATEAVNRCYGQASQPINLDDLP